MPPQMGRGICRQFASTGNCTFPNCKFSHEKGSSSRADQAPPKAKGPCLFFQTHGRCRYGENCRFSHDPSIPKVVEDPNSAVSLYRGWSQLLGSRTSLGASGGLLRELTADQMEKFLEDAWRILEIGTSETVQQLIGDLGSERGLRRIVQLVEANFVSGYSPMNLSFKRHCVPFLKIVAHEEMRASLVLEKEVGTIFNFIYGPGGRRGIQFFGRVAENLSLPSEAADRESFEKALLAAGSALFNILNLNQSAGVQEEFRKIANVLTTLVSENESNNPYNYTFRSIRDELGRIRVLLQMADAIPNSGLSSSNTIKDVLKYQYRLQVDLPGELSREGPRHDNDHADISKIKILPTSEEISSHRNEFLPKRSNEYPHHLEGISRVLDFQFRLLREDTSGQIREAVRTVQDNWTDLIETAEAAKGAKKTKVQNAGLRTLIYKNAQIERFKCTQRDGLALNVSFDQPPRIALLDLDGRIGYWNRSKSAQIGSLLCLVDSLKRCTFLVVSERVVNAADKSNHRGPPQEPESEIGIRDLASDPQRAMVTLRFAGTVSETDIDNLFTRMAGPEGTAHALVEFPGLLFTSFEPVMKCLQQVSKTGNLPFPKWLAPSDVYEYSSDPASKYVYVPPPLYMTKPGVILNLKSISNGEPLTYSITEGLSVADLQRATTLDNGQCEALISSLSQELALIQGPPGTGKSYLGVQIVKVLLDNREAAGIGPIICVCYTNHALDQFLEHLLKDGITKIVRIGSRSKSEAVAPLSLHNLTQGAERTKREGYQFAKAKGELNEINNNVSEACEQLLNPYDPKVLKGFLEISHPRAFAELFDEEDEEGWIRHTNKSRNNRSGVGQTISDWIGGRGFAAVPEFHPADRPIEELLTTNVLAMSRLERMRVFEHWHEEMKELAASKLLQATEDHAAGRQTLSRLNQENERRLLQDSHIVGLTTSGLASHADLIRSVNAKILICEEAAEVLEAHILSALLPSMEHAILIGDHMQLRPQILNHNFSMENPRGGKDYGLDTSLFERTAEIESYGGKKFPISKLDTQRRMHPSIANLVRNTLYPDLRDYPSTASHPGVPGLARRLFWMDHRELESGADKLELVSTSHANEWESDMCVSLVRHLSRQGSYKSGEIAVLSPYLRQLFDLRRKLASMFEVVIGDKDQEQLDEALDEDELVTEFPALATQQLKKGNLLNEVRVATVDNFQGEEAKVIIISMVRSNKENKCGFLKTSNRINVLLSRARDGMYIVGNAATCGGVEMWSKIIGMLEKDGNIDKRLELCCPRHREKPMFVTKPEDFHAFSPEGGCNERCEWRLNCGHPCVKKCHSEILHQSTVCLEPCDRSFQNCSHPCPKPCGVACGKCNERVSGIALPCGHVPFTLLCNQLQNLSEIRCKKTVKRKLSLCGHEVDMECWKDPKDYRCGMTCGALLPCGDHCGLRCRECTRARTEGGVTTAISVHGKCKRPCGRKYANCSHSCASYCHDGEPCSPCAQPCEIRCSHSRCPKTCSEPCAPCAERCSWTCIHRERCEMPCAVPCDINPCSERCEMQLECGHQCPSVCGERCPSEQFCQDCGPEDILGRVVDLFTLQPYAEIDINTEPIIVPTCGHFYTMETYDNLMGMKNAYNIDSLGRILGPKALDGSGDTGAGNGAEGGDEPPERLVVKNCPDCRAPLRDIHRYNRIVKTAYLDESTRRFCANSQKDYLDMYKQVSDAQDLLQANRGDFLTKLRTVPKGRVPDGTVLQVQARIERSRVLLGKIQRFIATVDEQEQPYSKVRQMVIGAQRRRNVQGTFVVDRSAVQMGFRLKSQNLFLAFRLDVLWDLHAIAESTIINATSTLEFRKLILKESRQSQRNCSGTIEECLTARLEKYEVEARIHRAQFFALARLQFRFLQSSENYSENLPNASNFDEEARLAEVRSLDKCEDMCNRLPGTVGPLRNQLEQARKLLRGGTFYDTVSAEEKRMVYLAMSVEFSSTGRWYTCENGHPFTIGNCGAANQRATCPECGAVMGGDAHGLAQGVRRAAEFVQMDQELGRMRLDH